MPIHDWAKLSAGMFHDFRQTWTVQIKTVLHTGLLPKGLTALVEQKIKDWQQAQPDVLAVESNRGRGARLEGDGGLLVLDPPATEMVFRTDEDSIQTEQIVLLSNITWTGPTDFCRARPCVT